jgi:hypothetical protein
MGFSDWWYYTGTITKILVIAGIAAIITLALIVASPHVAFLKPIAQGLGLVETVNHTVYVPVNHTVYVNRTIYVNYTKYIYVNKTVPVYINTTVYVPVPANGSAAFSSDLRALANLTGFCSGRIVVLPNNTAWFVVFWLVPKSYFETNPFMNYAMTWNMTHILVHYNSTTHYAQYILRIGLWAFVSTSISPWTATITGANWVCYYDNVTINNQYYVMVCGDTPGIGPINIGGLAVVNGVLRQETAHSSPALSYGINMTEYIYAMPRLNMTYTGIVFFGPYGGSVLPNTLLMHTFVPGPVCNITLTYAPNPQAALWLPVTTNQTLINYWRESVIPVYGWYNQYDNLMGYFVWGYPS